MDNSSYPKYRLLLQDLFLALLFVLLILILVDPFTSHFAQEFISYTGLSAAVVLLGFFLALVPAASDEAEGKAQRWNTFFPLIGSVLIVVLSGYLLREFGVIAWVAAALTGVLAWSILSADFNEQPKND